MKIVEYPGPLECLSLKALGSNYRAYIFYFTLSAQSSLYTNPFNQLISYLDEDIQVFSITLPYHNQDIPHKETVKHWRSELLTQGDFIKEFIEEGSTLFRYLEKQQFLDAKRCALAGLSRGAYIAAFLGSKLPEVPIILGFSPMSGIYGPEEMKNLKEKGLYQKHWDIFHFIPSLYQRHLHFFMGNHDELVGTDSCFSFIHQLSSYAHSQRHKPCPIEMTIFPSVGYKGHGTPPEIFQKGAIWLMQNFPLLPLS